MSQQTEALKMAVEALEEAKEQLGGLEPLDKLIQACKEALAQEQSFAEKTAQMSFMGLWDAYTTLKMKLEALEQPAQEPVAWEHFDKAYSKACNSSQPQDWMDAALLAQQARNTHPAPSWQGLSDDDVHNYADHNFAFASEHFEEIFNFYRAIEQALKEKNAKV